jgi:RHS repeat-associated protein
VTETVDANNKPSFSYFDGDGRATETVDADGHAAFSYFDPDGRVTQTVDAANHATRQAYDADGHRTSLTDADSNLTTFAYDPAGRRTATTDPLGHTSTSAYDPVGRLTSTTDRLGRTRSFAYDGDGHLRTETWYDASGHVSDTLGYSYDADGNQLTASNNNGSYTFTYDAASRMQTEQEPFGVSLTFAYDAAGNRTSVTDSLGGTLTSVYDGNGQLTSRRFSDSSGHALREDLGYDGDGRVTTSTRYADLAGTQAVGTTTNTYDPDGNLTGLQANDGGGTSLLSYTYAPDPNGWLTSQTLNGTTTSYTYDPTGQLTGAGSAAYSYDATGNRNLPNYVTTAGNQLQTDGTWNYHYDTEGNLSWKINPSTGIIWRYGYDDANRLVSALETWNTNPDWGVVPQGTGPDQFEVDYHYDVIGNRIEVIVTDYQGGNRNADTRFAYDGPNAWADLSSTNQLLTRRVYLDGMDQLVARISAGGVPAWYLTDRQGTVAALTDGAGHLVDQYQYDAFGNILSQLSAPWGDRYTYTAREYDSLTNRYYYRWRFEDALTGRFLSQDPLGFGAGNPNLYPYVGNSPTNATDPTGQFLVLTSEANSQVLPWLRGQQLTVRTSILPPYWPWSTPRVGVELPSDDRPRLRELLAGTSLDDPHRQVVQALLDPTYNVQWDDGGGGQVWGTTLSSAEEHELLQLRARLDDGARYRRNAAPEAALVTYGKDAFKGLKGGAGMMADAATGSSIEGLHQEAVQHAAEYDPTTVAVVRGCGVVTREAVIGTVAGGTLELGGRALGAAGEGLVEAGTLTRGQLCAAQTTAKVGMTAYQVVGTVQQARGLGEKLGAAYDAYEKGDETALAEALGSAGVDAVNLGYGIKDLAQLARQLGRQGFIDFFLSCFAAETPLEVPGGWRRIEELRRGDVVLSRAEGDPCGQVEAKVVEATFRRIGRVLHVHMRGQVIRTTAEHRFYVAGQGWRAAGALRPGDRLLMREAGWVSVEEVFDTGEYEWVYNVRVADFHTYFVGCEEWGFAVWAHNTCLTPAQGTEVAEQYRAFRQAGGSHGDFVFKHPETGEPLGPGQIRRVKEIVNSFPNIDRTGMRGPKVASQPVEDQRQNRLIARAYVPSLHPLTRESSWSRNS